MKLTKGLYTVKEVSKILGIHEQTLYDWIEQKKVKVIRLGRLIRIRREELNRILKRGV